MSEFLQVLAILSLLQDRFQNAPPSGSTFIQRSVIIQSNRDSKTRSSVQKLMETTNCSI
jgi:hypothetical protein